MPQQPPSSAPSPSLDAAVARLGAGDWAGAAELYERAYAEAVTRRDARALADVARRIGHLHRVAQDAELAEEYFGLSLTLSELLGDLGLVGRTLNGLGGLRIASSDFDRAEELFLQARALGEVAGDELLVGEAETNLAIVATVRGEPHVARARYTAAAESLVRAGSPGGLVLVHNNLGMLCVDLGLLDEADEQFARGLVLAREHGNVVATAGLLLNRADLYLARGLPEEAREACDQGFEIHSRVGNKVGMAEALKFYGMVYRETKKPHLAEIHLRQALELARDRDLLLEGEVQRELAAVLRQTGRNRESLEALNRAHALFTRLQARLDNADVERRIQALEDDFFSLVKQWGESIEAKDRYTSGHCVRVADYACRIATLAGIPEEELVWFRMGAFLHDVGKVDVPAELLNKPGRLTEEERRIMERHPITGDEMLSSVEFPWDVRGMVRWHHERWDGAGYPDRLAGEAVPLPARILRIADVFDALTSVRSYRPPMHPEQAFAVMEEDVGGFDPALFALFRSLLPELSPIAANAHEEALLSQRDLRG